MFSFSDFWTCRAVAARRQFTMAILLVVLAVMMGSGAGAQTHDTFEPGLERVQGKEPSGSGAPNADGAGPVQPDGDKGDDDTAAPGGDTSGQGCPYYDGEDLQLLV